MLALVADAGGGSDRACSCDWSMHTDAFRRYLDNAVELMRDSDAIDRVTLGRMNRVTSVRGVSGLGADQCHCGTESSPEYLRRSTCLEALQQQHVEQLLHMCRANSIFFR